MTSSDAKPLHLLCIEWMKDKEGSSEPLEIKCTGEINFEYCPKLYNSNDFSVNNYKLLDFAESCP